MDGLVLNELADNGQEAAIINKAQVFCTDCPGVIEAIHLRKIYPYDRVIGNLAQGDVGNGVHGHFDGSILYQDR